MTNRVLLSPRHFADQFANGWVFEDKVDVFEARIQGWQLDIAWDLARRDLSASQLAVVHLVFAYFEMIGKYIDGYLGGSRSRHYFKLGLKNVFPDIGNSEMKFMNSVYSNLRCGLYHLGRPASNVILNEQAPAALGYVEEQDIIMISPTKFLEAVQNNFEAYVRGLRNPLNPRLRTNFEARFEYDNKLELESAPGSA